MSAATTAAVPPGTKGGAGGRLDKETAMVVMGGAGVSIEINWLYRLFR